MAKSVFEARRELDEEYYRALDKQAEQDQREAQNQKLHKRLDKQSSQLQQLQKKLASQQQQPKRMPPIRDRITEQNFQDHKKELEMVNPAVWSERDRMLMYLTRQREQHQRLYHNIKERAKKQGVNLGR